MILGRAICVVLLLATSSSHAGLLKDCYEYSIGLAGYYGYGPRKFNWNDPRLKNKDPNLVKLLAYESSVRKSSWGQILDLAEEMDGLGPWEHYPRKTSLWTRDPATNFPDRLVFRVGFFAKPRTLPRSSQEYQFRFDSRPEFQFDRRNSSQRDRLARILTTWLKEAPPEAIASSNWNFLYPNEYQSFTGYSMAALRSMLILPNMHPDTTSDAEQLSHLLSSLKGVYDERYGYHTDFSDIYGYIPEGIPVHSQQFLRRKISDEINRLGFTEEPFE